jgi:uncharacterized protein YjbJ (UPF0337 family)
MEKIMNEDILKGKWHELKGHVKHQWGDLTDDDVTKLNGTTEELQGLLQKRYGYQKDEAKKQIDEFVKRNCDKCKDDR